MLRGQVPKLASLAAGLELSAQQLAYCHYNTSATNCSRLAPLLPVSKQSVHVHLLSAGESAWERVDAEVAVGMAGRAAGARDQPRSCTSRAGEHTTDVAR